METRTARAEQDGRNVCVSKHGRIGPETGTCDARLTADERQRGRQRLWKRVIGRHFISGPAEHRGSRSTKGRVITAERFENLPDLLERRRLRLTRQRAPLHLQRRAVGIATELAAALDERGMQRS